MGLFDDLGVNPEDLPETGYTKVKDGFYNFEISEVTKRQGTKNDPNVTKLTIEYDFDEDGSFTEWYTLAEDGDSSTPKALQSLGFLRDRLIDLGVDPATFDPDDEELVGLRGSLQLTTNAKGYQNARNVELEESDEPEEEPEPPKKTSAATKKAVAAKAARPAAKPASKRASDDAAVENPFE